MKNELNKTSLQLLELVKLGIWQNNKPDAQFFASCDWEAVYGLSKIQSVAGIAFDGVCRLYETIPSLCPERKLKLQWRCHSDRMLIIFKKHVTVLAGVHRILKEAGIKHVFMKGLTCGSRYPKPFLRTCGDIDFVVPPRDFDQTLDALEKISTVKRTLVHEHHGMAYLAGVVLEPHYKIHNYQNGKNDQAMSAMANELFQYKFPVANIFLAACPETKNCDVNLLVPVFPPEFEGMFLISHMVNHVYEEGLGLRQVVDFALWCSSCAGSEVFDSTLHFEYLERMRMVRAHRIFVRICEKYLGLSSDIFSYHYSQHELSFADKLMADVMKVGNFGRGEYVFRHNSKWDELKNYWWVTRRAVRLGYLCPSEAYMWPTSKLVRFFSKLLNPKKFQKIKS